MVAKTAETSAEITNVTANKVMNIAHVPVQSPYGKYGCASVLSTNFFSPASTAGC